MSTPNMSTLPLEIVLLICGQLESPTDRLNLVCCSRVFYKTFLPLLYQKLWTGGKLLRPIVRVTETLVTNPSLAACVETVHLAPWETYLGTNSADFDHGVEMYLQGIRINGEDEPYDWSQDGSVRLDQLDYSLIEEQAKRVTRSTDGANFWMDDIKMGNGDAWLALLLTVLPNLRRFEADIPYGTLWLHYVMRWNATRDPIPGPISSFPPISEAYVDWDCDDTAICVEHVMPFFLLPSMRRFYARNLDGGPGSSWDQLSSSTPMDGTSPVTHIEIDGCNGGWNLSKVIRSCKNLQSFKYNHRGCTDYNPNDLYSALLPRKETLDTLWLDILERFNRHKPPHQCDDSLPSFQDFPVLKTLHLRLRNLPIFDTDMSLSQALPPSIETLHIADTGSLDDLRVFAQKLQYHVDTDLQSTPALKHIDFKPLHSSLEGSQVLDSLTSVCAKANIDFCVYGIPGGRVIRSGVGFAPRPSRPALIDRF